MGGNYSTVLNKEDIDEFSSITVFNKSEIENLYERFKILDRNNVGYITYQNLLMIPEFVSNPLSQRIIQVLEEYTDYENLSFPLFLEFLQIFSYKSEKDNRIMFLFRIFDLNGDGKLCRNVFYRIFKKFSNKDPTKYINDIFIYYDHDCKGYLDYDDFYKFYIQNNMDNIFSYDFDNKDIERKVEPGPFDLF